jgi:hypothetical protein
MPTRPFAVPVSAKNRLGHVGPGSDENQWSQIVKSLVRDESTVVISQLHSYVLDLVVRIQEHQPLSRGGLPIRTPIVILIPS